MLKKDVSYIFYIILAFSLYVVIVGASNGGGDSGSCCGCSGCGCCDTTNQDLDDEEDTPPPQTEDEDVEERRTPHQNDCNNKNEETYVTVESFGITEQDDGRYTYDYSFKIMACKTTVHYQLDLFSTDTEMIRHLPLPKGSSYTVQLNNTETAGDSLHDEVHEFDKLCIKVSGENIDTSGQCCSEGGTQCVEASDVDGY